MRIFVLRARKSGSKPHKMLKPGASDHVEIIAHTVINAFYYSQGMRDDVEVYIVLDSTPDFPRTLKLSSQAGLSFPGFHEHAILQVLSLALKQGAQLTSAQQLNIAPGIEIYGFGFDTLLKQLQALYPVYLLDKKGQDIRQTSFTNNSVFVLSDHLPMPKNSIKGLERYNLTKISLCKKILFASQCVTLVHNELDR